MYLSIDLSIDRSVDPSIHLSFYPYVCPFTYRYIDRSIDRSIYLYIDRSIYRSNLPIYRSVYLSIDLSIYPYIDPSIHISIDLIYRSIDLSIYLSFYRSIHRNIDLSIYRSIHQNVVINSKVVRGALRYLCLDLGPGEQLLQISDYKFRQIWFHVVKALGLADLALRPYSMRRGGATWLWRASLSYDVVAHRGRWSGLSTCRRYVEDSAAALADLQLTEWQREQLGILGHRFRAWAAGAFPPDEGSDGW